MEINTFGHIFLIWLLDTTWAGHLNLGEIINSATKGRREMGLQLAGEMQSEEDF